MQFLVNFSNDIHFILKSNSKMATSPWIMDRAGYFSQIHFNTPKNKNATPSHAFSLSLLPLSRFKPLSPISTSSEPPRRPMRRPGVRWRWVHGEVGVPVRAERHGGGFAGGIPDTENRGRILAEASARGSPLGADRRRVREVVRSPLHRYSLGPLRVNVSGFVTLCLFLFVYLFWRIQVWRK